jgi:protein arginine kinase activator
MKCHICHQHAAQIVFTQIVANEKRVRQICTECAAQKGLSIEFETSDSHVAHTSSVIENFVQGISVEQEEEMPDLVCDACGLTFSEFRKSGLFGCAKCPEAFEQELDGILRKIHGVDVHAETKIEPHPKPSSRKPDIRKTIKKLRAELKQCVVNEEYEKAAELRDRIGAMQKEIDTNDV